MAAKLENDDNIDEEDDQAESEDIKDSEDQSFLDDLDALKIEFLDLSAPVSNARRSDSIDDIRERMANSKRTILIGDFNGKKRVAIQRNTVRLVTFEIDVPGLTDEQAREIVRQKILRGDFDYHFTTLYREKWAKLKH